MKLDGECEVVQAETDTVVYTKRVSMWFPELEQQQQCDEGLTLPGTQLPSIIPPSGGVMRQKLPGAGGTILRVSLMHAPRYGKSLTAFHVMFLCDLNVPRISVTSFLYVLSLVRTRYSHALTAMAVVSLPAPLRCS